MSIATISPINNQFALVQMGEQERTIEMDQVAAMTTALRNAEITVEIVLKKNGFRIDSSAVSELLEMAGLSSFQAAKATASGKITI